MNLDSFFRAQAEAQANFVFECEDCGVDNIDYSTRGRNAGKARCRACGNTWMWKDRANNTVQKSSNVSSSAQRSVPAVKNSHENHRAMESFDDESIVGGGDSDDDDDFQRMLDRVQRGEDPLQGYKAKGSRESDDSESLGRASPEPAYQRGRVNAVDQREMMPTVIGYVREESPKPSAHYSDVGAWPTVKIQRNTRPVEVKDEDLSSESDYMPDYASDSDRETHIFKTQPLEETFTPQSPTFSLLSESPPPEPVKRKRGRPRKNLEASASSSTPRAKKGRPSKTATKKTALLDMPDRTNLTSLLFPGASVGKGKENATASQDMLSDTENDASDNYVPNGFDGFSDDEDNGLQEFKLDYPKKRKNAALNIPKLLLANPSVRWNDMTEEERKELEHKARYSHFKPRPTNKYNPFLLYNRAIRKGLSDEHPGISTKELSALVAQKWKSLDPETKDKYVKEAQERKAAENKARGHRGRNERFPANPYILFSKVMGAKLREENPDYKIQDTNGLLATKWREMPDEEKEKYREQFKEMKEKFIKENPEYMKERQLKMTEARRRTKLTKQMFQ